MSAPVPVYDPAMAASAVEPWRIDVETFLRLEEQGFFDDQRVELIDGVISPRDVSNPPHDDPLSYLTWVLARDVVNGYVMRPQMTMVLGKSWAPQPDLALVRRETFEDEWAVTADWVCEVSNRRS